MVIFYTGCLRSGGDFTRSRGDSYSLSLTIVVAVILHAVEAVIGRCDFTRSCGGDLAHSSGDSYIHLPL